MAFKPRRTTYRDLLNKGRLDLGTYSAGARPVDVGSLPGVRLGDFLGVRLRISPILSKFLREGETIMGVNLKEIAHEYHDQVVHTHVRKVYENYVRARQANRRPSSRTGALGNAINNAAKTKGLTHYSHASFKINWDWLDHVVPKNNGFDYWRSVEYGYRPTVVQGGMFIGMGGGGFFPPTRSRDKVDPRVAQGLRRGSEFTVRFEGYRFLTPELEYLNSTSFLKDYSSEMKERFELDFGVKGWSNYVRFVLGGGRFDRIGRPMSSGGRLVRGADYDL